MTGKFVRFLAGLALCACLWPTGRLHAQGVTTGAITGTITDEQGAPLTGAQVQVINRSTGYSTGTISRANGLYLMQGLEVGASYTVRAQLIGYRTAENNDVRVTLSEATRVDFKLIQQAVEIAALTVTGDRGGAEFSPTKQGVSTLVSDSMISKLPTLSRDFLDLVKLAPQVVKPQDGSGFSASGQWNRLNAYTIDGSNQGDRFNLQSSGSVPGGAANAKLISQDAVKEFRVTFTPTDVRQGNFTGMLVNAVTRSGTNEFKGGATFTYRSSDFNADPIRNLDLSVKQYGFNLGGPIIKDRLHFFVAPEWQQRSSPMNGPYVGYTGTEPNRIPGVSQDSINRIVQIAQGYGLDAGTTGLISNKNPLTNLFGRIDFQINANHRLVARQIWNKSELDEFSRNLTGFRNDASTQNSGFRLTSNSFTRESKNSSSVVQLYSNFKNGWQNELIGGYNYLSDIRIVPLQTPEISVGVRNGTATGAVTFGTEQFSPNNTLRQKITEVVDNLTIPMGVHTFTVGGRFEHDYIYNNFAQRSYGVWVFPTIADFAARTPSGYTYGYSNSGNPSDIAGAFSVEMYSLYAQDQWAVNDKLTVTAGLRTDIPRMLDKPLENDTIARYFTSIGLHTSDTPKTQALWSPRLGFNYDISGQRTTQLRGSVGIYTGPPPFILVGNAYQNTGLQLVTLVCNSTATAPAFTIDVNNMPKACNGQPVPAPGQAGTAGVNHTDPDFKYPQSFTASAGFDTRLPWDVTATIEGLYRKSINGVLVRDLNLIPRTAAGAAYTDRNGRVLYADTFGATNSATVTNSRILARLRGANFSEGMIDVTNQSKDYNYSLSLRLNKRFSNSFDGTVGYTYMQSKDVQSLTSDRAVSNFRNGRTIATSHEDLNTTTSYFERPHRMVASGSYTLPWRTTTVSMFYQGISGTPYTYTVNGDINGDQQSGNDAIYIPLNATDVNEIHIGTGSGTAWVADAAEAQAFENFIAGQDCLSSQRGKIMERNSCRSPFQHSLDASVRQAVSYRGQSLSIQLDLFNFLNLLNKDWGAIELPTLSPVFPQQNVLRAQSRTAGALNQSYVNYTFDMTAAQRAEGPFQKQTGASNYWQTQLTIKYAF